jgi:serine protease Do
MNRISGHPAYPITVSTCEEHNTGAGLRPLVPKHDQGPILFEVGDPFGLRKAIVPLFRGDNKGTLHGMGTGFALDSWGHFLTADHVVDFLRVGRERNTGPNSEYILPDDEHLLALRGIGLVFGTFGMPPDAFMQARTLSTPAMEFDDPLNFSGAVRRQPFDIAFVTVAAPPSPTMILNLPIRSRPPSPGIGDLVIAVGFPQIKLTSGRPESLPPTLTEGMYAGYGVVRELYPEGRDRSSPTPAFEVEANWPSGMSGGPVFNQHGEVIGLVSRGIDPAEGELFGTAWAAWLAAVPPHSWPFSVDDGDAFHRKAWAAVRTEPWSVEGFPTSRDEAEALACSLGSDFVARPASSRLGTEGMSISMLDATRDARKAYGQTNRMP